MVRKFCRIAVIMACRNRKDITLKCLLSLLSQTKSADLALELFIVDDGSTDGTSEAVIGAWPSAHVVSGNGHLYWNGAMRVAFSKAMARKFEYYLWLNDDLVLKPEALQKLLSTHQQLASQTGRPAIVVGCLTNDQGQEMTYGGWVRTSRGLKFGLRKSFPQLVPMRCDSMNGNCVLIPHEVAAIVGNLRPEFTHSMGDLDYGLRASKLGCQVWEAPGYVGVAGANDGRGLWHDPSVGLFERWHRLLGPKGLPIAEWYEFTKRHAGPLWFLYWINPYVKFWMVGLARIVSNAARQWN